MALKHAYGEEDDYAKYDGEHTLNNGGWHWMNYVLKGEKKKDLFEKYCPVTIQLLD